MRLHFQERPWDLIVSLGYVVAISAVMVVIGSGNYLALFLIIFFPGYALVSLLFPTRSQLDWIERIALSFGLSIGIVPLFTLTLNFTPLGINLASTIAAIDLFVILVGIGAYLRRIRLPIIDRPSLDLEITSRWWHEYNRGDKLATTFLIIGIIVACGALAYVLKFMQPGERFTEFYLLGSGGNASGYPTALNISERATVILGVSNHESAIVSYTIRVDLVGMRIVQNFTTGLNETVELNRTTRSWINFTCADGQNRTQPYSFFIGSAGLWKIEFVLYKDNVVTRQELQLFVTIS